MSGAANVRSIDAVSRFRGSLRRFEEEAAEALLALDQQINKALQWLDAEQPAYWQAQMRRQYDEVARTRNAWNNCLMRVVAGDRPSCLEEEKAHRLAKAKLEQVNAKPEAVRRWSIKVHREVDEFRGRTGTLRQMLERDLPRMIALLERTEAALEAYLERPAVEDDAPPAADAGSATGADRPKDDS